MSYVRPEGNIVINGWMRTQLDLKGNELIIYGIIQGFTQFGDLHKFTGSLQYLADWAGCSRDTARVTVNSLVEKGLLLKEDVYKDNQKFCMYTAVTPIQISSTVLSGKSGYVCTENQDSTVPKTSNKTINKTINKNNKDNVTSLKPKNNTLKQMKDKKNSVNLDNTPYEEIIEYLNSKAGKKYKPTTKEYRKLIKARFDEGYTLDDFKVVIDNKCLEWLGDESTKQWLRPTTLFGDKFERYLIEEPIVNKGKQPPASFDGQEINSANSNGRRRL
ncbi:MAG: conserved phage C-terminal domain-containing protein [Romboutsia timonensis]